MSVGRNKGDRLGPICLFIGIFNASSSKNSSFTLFMYTLVIVIQLQLTDLCDAKLLNLMSTVYQHGHSCEITVAEDKASTADGLSGACI